MTRFCEQCNQLVARIEGEIIPMQEQITTNNIKEKVRKIIHEEMIPFNKISHSDGLILLHRLLERVEKEIYYNL